MGQKTIAENTLFYGDNLPILRDYLADESVDLIYLDPPFNSSRSYNVLYKDESGMEAEAQIVAFEDTWHWSQDTETQYHQLLALGDKLAQMLETLIEVLGRNQMTAYLVMMTVRLIELHRVLKPTGSLYLHCDPTASHYLKMILDMIFGVANFRNEIVWKRQTAHSDAKHKFSDIADSVLFYGKSAATGFYPQYGEHNPDYVAKFYRNDDHDGRGLYQLADMASPNPRPNMMYEWLGFPCPEKGWRYQRETMQKLHDEGRVWYPRTEDGTLDTTKRPRLKRYFQEQEGSIVTSIWTDIQPLHATSAERIGYPTQKPVALLERIIQASSHPGDIILDPFCGCGTAIHAAQKLGRTWIGIDITYLATSLIKNRLYSAFGIEAKKDYALIGEPSALSDARHLAKQDRYQFQWWALGLLPARPFGGQADSKHGKKGADKGIDGIMTFRDSKESDRRIIVQVKSGKVKSGDIRDLHGTVEREKNAVMGVFITLETPSQNMQVEAMECGYYHSTGFNRDYPKIQIMTIEQLLEDKKIIFPGTDTTLKQAQREYLFSENKQEDLL
jgi:site-specific DNA-methyltransferase (adenine-specific)